MPTNSNPRPRIPGVPELVWSTTQQEEVVDQHFGCIGCLADGVIDTPTMVFFYNGSTFCRAHTLQQVEIDRG